ncbi:hypothetical protein EOK75_05275 [Pseudorhodobacter turbinis]|uniref:Pycsar effector protein domain-containing protein n=1 Tax=Pseudorhodobacter turbinis TaxID=2500533 RepID=A0A4P8EFI8_9RHOB|nr:hypothetical protein [Pseudorhodobacter turbinis]QCO55235.1 hypothetical protein EOK75_05275 [Pseudorhodobacter turbinis]
MAIDSKIAGDQLNRILTFFPRVDNRASMLFAANSAILGVLAARVRVEHLQNWQVLIPAGLTLAALVYSFGSLYLCAYPNTGPVALSCRSKCSFKPPFVQKRPDFSNPMLSGVVADCRSRVWMPLSMQEVFQIAWNK